MYHWNTLTWTHHILTYWACRGGWTFQYLYYNRMTKIKKKCASIALIISAYLGQQMWHVKLMVFNKHKSQLPCPLRRQYVFENYTNMTKDRNISQFTILSISSNKDNTFIIIKTHLMMEYWKITVVIFPSRQSIFPSELFKLPWQSPQKVNTGKYSP